MAYTIVAICVLLLKYEINDEDVEVLADERDSLWSKLFNIYNLKWPTEYTSGLVTVAVTLYAVFSVWLCLVITFLGDKILEAEVFPIILVIVPVIVNVFLLIVIARQPRSSKQLTFTVPCNPWFPALSILINIYLLVQLDLAAWIRFVVWMIIGLVIYIFYGRRYSKVKEICLINEAMDRAFDEVEDESDEHSNSIY